MFWRKMFAKVVKSRRHIGINLYPTSICDTGCRHCTDDSNCKNPVHFTAESARTIIKEARRERWDLSVLLTGGGEPSMCPELVEIASVFKSYERLRYFEIFTSGFINKDIERKKRLIALSGMKNSFRQISLSFSLYHESFPERLKNMARLMFQTNDKSFFCVRACVSLENCQRTNQLFEESLSEFAEEIDGLFYRLPIGWFPGGKRNLDFFEHMLDAESYVYKFKQIIELESHLAEQWYVVKTAEGHGVVICLIHISLAIDGRAESINETPYGYLVCDELQSRINGTYLNIGPDGSVYPDCGCYPDEHMRLGKIGKESLVELVRRRDAFSGHITKAVIADKRMYEWGTRDLCRVCKQIVAEKGLGF